MFTPQAAVGKMFKAHIGVYKGRVVLDFGVSLSHLELEPHEARMIADLLLKHAMRAEMKDASSVSEAAPSNGDCRASS